MGDVLSHHHAGCAVCGKGHVPTCTPDGCGKVVYPSRESCPGPVLTGQRGRYLVESVACTAGGGWHVWIVRRLKEDE